MNKNKNYILFLFFILWLIFNFICVIHHAHFRDEGTAWMIARELNLSNFRSILSYEGHGVLWYCIIKAFMAFGLPFKFFSFISLGVSAVTVIILFRTNINTFSKILIAFSPLISFYNTAVARSYCLCALELVILLYLYKQEKKNPILIGITAFFMLQTHLYTAVVAIMVILWLIYNSIVDKKIKLQYLTGSLIGILGILFIYYTLGMNCSETAKMTLINFKWFLNVIFFLDIDVNTNINGFFGVYNFLYRLLISIFLVYSIRYIKVCYLRLLFALAIISGLSLINSVYPAGHAHHRILLTSIILFCIYIVNDKIITTIKDKYMIKFTYITFNLVLIVSIGYTLFSFKNDFTHDSWYSNAKIMSSYILKNHKNDVIYITENDDKFSNLAAYLGENNNLVFVLDNKLYTFYDRKDKKTINYKDYKDKKDKKYFIFVNGKFDDDLELVHSCDAINKWGEDFYLYKRKEN